MGDLLDWLLKEENRKSCRIVGLFLTILPLLFFFGGGFPQGADGQGIIFSSRWFREVFIVILSLLFILGLILVVAGFSRKKKQE